MRKNNIAYMTDIIKKAIEYYLSINPEAIDIKQSKAYLHIREIQSIMS